MTTGVGREPQPGLARLPELIEQVSAAGLRVELAVGGEPRDLPPGVDLSAYRIVQEALTNTLKHARAENVQRDARATRTRRLDLEILDDGAGGEVAGAGRGIIGMRERVGAASAASSRPGRARERRLRGLAPRSRCEVPGVSIRVLLCDDQALVRSGFRMILETREDLEVVGEAEDGVQALELAWRQLPDVILMDVRMPRLDGVEATRRLVAAGSEARVLILTTFDLDEYVFEALRAGASGFLLKDVQPAQLVDAIRVVARGEALLAPTVTRRLLDRFARSLPGAPEPPAPELADADRPRARGARAARRAACQTPSWQSACS